MGIIYTKGADAAASVVKAIEGADRKPIVNRRLMRLLRSPTANVWLGG